MVPRDAYFFRTLMRFTTGAPAWQHLNKVMAIAVGQREARTVLLDAGGVLLDLDYRFVRRLIAARGCDADVACQRDVETAASRDAVAP